MNLSLRRARVAVACCVFAAGVAAFLGGSEANAVAQTLPKLQLLPALLAALTDPFSLSMVALVTIIVLTLLFGRLYCACLCPLGILQDLARRLGRSAPALRKLQDRQQRRTGVWRRPMRHLVLGATTILALLGSLTLLNLLEPFSLFGRIATNLGGPVAEGVRIGLASVCEQMEIHHFSEPGTWSHVPGVLALTATVFLALIAMSALRGRLYCNTVCPVGALLGLLSQGALFRIRMDSDACAACGLCARQCRGDCIHVDTEGNAGIDDSSCVRCFDCLSACPAGSLTFGPAPRGAYGVAPSSSANLEVADSASPSSASCCAPTMENAPPQLPHGRGVTNSRRDFLGLATASLAGVAAVPLRTLVTPRLLPVAVDSITPPGSVGIEHFASRCTGCHLCVSACPTGVIRPGVLQYGLRGFMQPTLSYRHGYCDYDCNACSRVCPTGAIQALSLEQKQGTQIGVAALLKNRCIVYLRDEECGACAEVCPTHAIYTVEREGILCPETDAALCVGCGMCEHVCPQRPRAIVVQGASLHGKARKPFSDAPSAPTTQGRDQSDAPAGDEFPF